MNVYVLLFNQYEPLDAFGPVEILGRAGHAIHLVSIPGGVIKDAMGNGAVTEKAQPAPGIWLIPGGAGTRPLSKDRGFLKMLQECTAPADWILSVCTGSALLAAAGLLDGRRATSNKNAFRWAKSTGPRVLWQPCARWAADGKFYTASGVSAGIDMALGFVADREGKDTATALAWHVEYVWNDHPENDPFAVKE